MSYERLMLFAFILSAAFCVTAGLFSFFFKALTKEEWSGKISTTDDSASETKNVAVKTVSVLEMFRRPIFYLLVPANLLRGFATGAVTVFATVAITLGFDNTALAPFLSPAALLFSVLGCGLLSGVMFFALRILRKASPTFLRGKPHLLRRANKQAQK